MKQSNNIPVFDKSAFNQEIELFVKNTGESYIDAVIHYAEKRNMEVETVSKMLNKVIRQKIESEASDLNLLREKLCKLPVWCRILV